jgi:hypothetical protein
MSRSNFNRCKIQLLYEVEEVITSVVGPLVYNVLGRGVKHFE